MRLRRGGEVRAALAAGQSRRAEPVGDGDQLPDVAPRRRRLVGQHRRVGADAGVGGVVAIDVGERGGEAVVMGLRLPAMAGAELPPG